MKRGEGIEPVGCQDRSDGVILSAAIFDKLVLPSNWLQFSGKAHHS